MYVCICNAVTDKDIRRAAANGADSLYDLQDRLGVASCCGSCASQASSILADANVEAGVHLPQGEPVLYTPAIA